MLNNMRLLHHILLIGFLVFSSGCGKQYSTPSLPISKTVDKVFDNEITKIEQSQISTKDIDAALNGCPDHMAATAFRIKNKTDKPIILEIDHTNVGTYDAEDLALAFSKIGLNHPRIKELTVGHDISRGLTIGITSILSGALMYTLFKELKNNDTFRTGGTGSPPNYWLLTSASALMTLPIIALGAYVYSAINADREDIVECEQERLIDQFRQMFESAVLAFEDCIEIAPNESIDQIIFYDTRPVNPDTAQQQALVLRCTSGDKKIQIPLEI